MDNRILVNVSREPFLRGIKTGDGPERRADMNKGVVEEPKRM
jgi:hypothetical protein